MPKLQIVHVDGDTLRKYVAPNIVLPVSGYLAIENNEIIGSFGLTWGAGRCWLWFGHSDASKRHPYTVIRWAKRLLRQACQLGEAEVFTTRDATQDSSRKLLKLLDFEYVGLEPNPITGGQEEVFKWQHCK